MPEAAPANPESERIESTRVAASGSSENRVKSRSTKGPHQRGVAPRIELHRSMSTSRSQRESLNAYARSSATDWR